MKPEEMRSLLETAAKAWETGDAQGFAELFTTDGKFIIPGQQWTGQGEIESAAREFAQKNANVQVTLSRIIVEGDVAVAEWHWENTDKEKGVYYQADDAIVVDFLEGKITRWREYIDSRVR